MEQQSAQKTPTGQQIPVPTREDVLANLRKVAKADKSKSDTSAGSADKK